MLDALAAGRDAVRARPARRSCSSACSRRTPSSAPARRRRRRGRPHRAHARHARARAHRDRHLADPRRDRRPAAGAARGPLADPALDRRAGHDRVGGRLHRAAPRLRGRRGLFVSHVPERIAENHFLEEIATLPTHRRRRRRGLGRARRRAVRGVRHRDRADDAGAGRAGEDLDQHPALHAVRAAEPADDGVRAVRRERLRRDRADQPRLPARRDGEPGLTAGACLRKDFAFSEERSSAPGMLLAVSRVHETVPLFLVEGLKRAARRLAARPQGRRARADLQARLRRRAATRSPTS